MKAVVTGATGFVGSHLVERLLADGMTVQCLVRPTSNTRWIRDLPVETCVAPLDDVGALTPAVEGADIVFHVAGLTRARTEDAYMRGNADTTRCLLDAVLAAPTPAPRFVAVSSLAAAGPNPGDEPLDESVAPHPLPGYGASKRAAERLVLEEANRLHVVVVRPPGVYGPRDTNLLPLFRTAKRWRIAPIVGGPDRQASFVHVTDLVEGIRLAAGADVASGEVYFLGSGTYSRRELMDAIATALGVGARVLSVPNLAARLIGELGELTWTLTGKPQIVSRRKVRDMLQKRWTCSWAKAERELDYHPRIDLAEGMRETAEWYRANGWV